MATLHPGLDIPWLGQVVAPDRGDWTPTLLRGIAAAVASGEADRLREVARYDADHRWAARIAWTQHLEVWLLSWLPGQTSDRHPHDAPGAFAVLDGEVTETVYRRGQVESETPLPAGAAVGFPARRAHRLVNTGAHPALSVHVHAAGRAVTLPGTRGTVRITLP